MQEIRYKCVCFEKERELFVRFRAPDEDILDYMSQIVSIAIYLDHSTRSPKCKETIMTYAKLYYHETANELFGKPPVN